MYLEFLSLAHRSSKIFFLSIGGPLVTFLDEEQRFILLGTLHGGFRDCVNDFPNIYTRVDRYEILKFVRNKVFNEDLEPPPSTTTTTTTTTPRPISKA